MKKLFFRIVKGVTFVLFWAIVILYLTQDIQIFPSSIAPLLPGSYAKLDAKPPKPFTEINHSSTDNTKIKVWKIDASPKLESMENLRAIVLHGNGGSLRNFQGMQTWLSGIGITNYSFDYRGTGASSGWPSEPGILLDTVSVFNLMLKEEGVSAEDTIVVGLSIGTGFATILAAEVAPKALILFAPYQSIPDLARDRVVTRYLTPLLRYDVSTIEAIAKIDKTCILVVHGVDDSIIPVSHSHAVTQNWSSSGFRWFKTFDNTGHNDLFNKSNLAVEQALSDCLER